LNNLMEYKGYYGSVEYSREDELLHGEIFGIKNLIMYDGTCLSSLRKCFIEAVENYLEMCEEEGIEPEKPTVITDDIRRTA